MLRLRVNRGARDASACQFVARVEHSETRGGPSIGASPGFRCATRATHQIRSAATKMPIIMNAITTLAIRPAMMPSHVATPTRSAAR
jgi:hypothetical protein